MIIKKTIFYCVVLSCLWGLMFPRLVVAQEGKNVLDSMKMDSIHRRNEEILAHQVDIADLYHQVFHPHKKADSTRKRSPITIIPNIAANPTIGLQGGIKAVAGKVLGHVPGTYMSVAATSASATTKGILYFYFVHNVFTPGNKWNLQGSIVASKSVSPDFGLGMGKGSDGNLSDQILTNPSRKPYVWHSEYYNFREKAYKRINGNLFLGMGMEFNVRRNITNPNKVAFDQTPMGVYSTKYGFDSTKYMANGFLFNMEYTTRDNINRPYKGFYMDMGLRLNQTWIGSSKDALVFTGDARKYFSLSERNPETVLGLWVWGSSVLTGHVPYMELPGTGRDPSFRSGRGYIASYFRGTQYFYSESEFRFPITRNKLFSGVTFVNIETTNDLASNKIFEVWKPAAGLGLRVLFNKATRTNLCLDYAWGSYGQKGFFLGLNEAF
ncbi:MULTISPECIES: BamA/TamA family outer membrane protein [Chitinophagaceae]